MSSQLRFELLSGRLLLEPGSSPLTERAKNVEWLEFKTRVPGSHWDVFEYRAREPLMGEEPLFYSSGLYRYRLFLRKSGGRLVAVSSRRKIVDHFMQENLATFFCEEIHALPVNVDGVVRQLVAEPLRYGLTYCHARVPGYGESLRAISFYGEDLSEAKLFRDHLEALTFFTCGLREVKTKTGKRSGTEVVRLSNDGGISFFFGGVAGLKKVERALGFLRSGGFLLENTSGSGEEWRAP